MTPFDRVVAWAGGTMFVLSLAACGYSYLIVWASPTAAASGWSVASAITIDAVLFGVFALHHSLFARESLKATLAQVVPDRLIRSLYVWIASALLLLVLALWQPVAGELYRATGWRVLVHAAVQISGLWLIGRAVTRIDALELAGIKPASGGRSLQIAGPYRWVRHPVYLGWLLAVFGAAHLTGDRVTFAAISTAYVLVAIPWEERSLLRLFGEPYADYRRMVRWRILPYVY